MKSFLSTALFLFSKSKAAGGGFDYEDPSHWKDAAPMCGTNDQSPINLQSAEAVYAPDVCKPALNWTIDWSIHSFFLSNGGSSIVLSPLTRYDAEEDDATGETVVADDDGDEYMTRQLSDNVIARLPNYFLPEGSPNEEFCLHSFHFHWGQTNADGSEHLLDDESYPLEVHFVHYACATGTLGGVLGKYAHYANITAAQAQDLDYHELAVVGIFFDVTEYDNPAFDRFLSEDIVEEIQYANKVDPSYPAGKVIHDIYLQDIIPLDLFTSGYYSYEGSLTTPPCTPIVRWHVSNSRSYIGKNQISRFRELMMTKNMTQAPNFRPPQFNVNPVYACMDGSESESERNKTEVSIIATFGVIIVLMMICFAGFCYWRSVRESRQPPVQASPKQRPRVFSASSAGSMHLSVDHTHGHLPVSTPTAASSAEALHHH